MVSESGNREQGTGNRIECVQSSPSLRGGAELSTKQSLKNKGEKMKRKYVVGLLLAVGFLFLHGSSHAFEMDHDKVVLDNGARIVARYVPELPVVIIQIRVLSGLSNEGEYAGTGISHFLEHLLFRGTKDMNSEELLDTIRQMGGMINGFTGTDSAAYHLTIPVDNFDKAVDLLTRMVMELEFSNEEFDTEKKVVLKEMNLHHDNPGRKRYNYLLKRAYLEHVYKYPIIGYMDLFERLQKEDIRRYHSSAYTPDRLVMGIVGGVPTDIALKTACSSLEVYQRGIPRLVTIAPEPVQLASRAGISVGDINTGYMAIGFHGTSLFSKDMYAMDMLSFLLGKGSGATLYRKLVKDEELLHGVSSNNMTPRYPGLFVINATGDPDVLDEARIRIFEILKKIKEDGVSAEDLERVKNLAYTSYVGSNENIDNMVFYMTSSELMTGEPDFYEKFIEEVNKLTSEDLKRVAKAYLQEENSTTIKLLPKGSYAENESVDKALDKGSIKEEKSVFLDNGLKVIVKKRGRLPIAAARLIMPGGIACETIENNGIANVTARMLVKGTTSRKEEEIVPVIENMGAGIGSSSGQNSATLSLEFLSKDMDKCFEILADVVKNPIFPEKELSKVKKLTEKSINIGKKEPVKLSSKDLRALLYGTHPYSMEPAGEIVTVENISKKDVVDFYKNNYSPKGTAFVIVGDVDIEQTIDKVEKYFGDWDGPELEAVHYEIAPLTETLEKENFLDREQATLIFGFPGVAVYDERKYALSVLSSMLSGSGGILFEEIRGRQGLAYSVSAWNTVMYDPGFFGIYAGVTEDKLPKTKRSIIKLIEGVKKGDFSEDLVTATKYKLLTNDALNAQSNSSITAKMANGEFFGFGYDNYKTYPDKIKAVTKEEVVKVANDILDFDKCAVVITRRGSKS
jgi:zinc protease